MNETQSVLFVLFLSTVGVSVLIRMAPLRERIWLSASWIIHVTSAFAQAWLTIEVYRGGDMLLYVRSGVELGAALRSSGGSLLPEVMNLLFQQPARLPVLAWGGPTTGSMVALMGLLAMVMNGGVYTYCLVFALTSFLGKMALNAVFRAVFPEVPWRRTLACMMFLPSVVFWSTAPLKESVTLTGLGFATLAFHRLGEKRRLSSGLLLVLGLVLIGLTKPYVLVALIVAGAAWFYGGRLLRAGERRPLLLHPVALLLSGVVLVAGLSLVGTLFERFSLENLAEEAARQQEAGRMYRGGSSYTIGDPSAGTLVGQLAFAPVALLSAFFRPFIFESTSALIFLNSLETTLVAFLTARIAFTRSPRDVLRSILGRPWISFAVAYVLVLGLGVGLATTNLGTLSRYRMPIQPFFVMTLLVLNVHPRRSRSVEWPLREESSPQRL